MSHPTGAALRRIRSSLQGAASRPPPSVCPWQAGPEGPKYPAHCSIEHTSSGPNGPRRQKHRQVVLQLISDN